MPLLIELFNKIVEKNQNKISVVSATKSLTYKELDNYSTQIAKVIAKKITKGDNIGVIYTKDSELIIVILAILKAGGVYIPIDPRSPQQRIDYILENARTDLVIGKPEYQYLVNETRFYSLANLFDQHNDEICLPNLDEDDNAYIIYTSGTTGNPKGVIIPHTNITYLISSIMKASINISNADVWTMYHSYAFDFSIWEIFSPLLTGGQLHILEENVIQDLSLLIDYITRSNISVLSLTPSVFKRLLNQDNIQKIVKSSLRYIVFGGERFDLNDYQQWCEKVKNSNVSLVNMYGITETTVHTTFHHLNDYDLTNSSASPIGKPLAHFNIKLLDENRNEVKKGEVGEIYVSGNALAKGYFNNPKLTNEKFINLTLPKDKTKNIYYKTGDLAKVDGDDILYYIGRSDRQVKFHGYRIELDGIESTLLKHDSIHNCLIYIDKKAFTEVMICFYQAEFEISELELKKHLTRYLPSYMVPNSFIFFDNIPTNINGKIDKEWLLEKYNANRTVNNLLVSSDPNVVKLAKIWGKVLKHENIDYNSDFFKIGGYSLLVTELTKEVVKEFSLDVKTVDLIRNPIFSSYLNTILDCKPLDASSTSLKIKNSLSPSPNQQGLFYTCQFRTSSEYNVGFILYFNQKISFNKIKQSLLEILESQIAFKINFEQYMGELRLKINDCDENCIRNEDFNSNKELNETALEWNKHSFDLTKFPLYQFRSGTVEGKYTYLYINIHHTIIDGYSLNIFIKLLLESLNGHEIIKDDSYLKFIERSIDNKTIESKNFWNKYLNGISSIKINLPNIKAYKEQLGNSFELAIDKDTSTGIDTYCKEVSISQYTYYLASFGVLINYITDNNDFIIGVPYANREVSYMDSIGYYVNTLPVRIKFSDTESKIDSLRRLDKNNIELLIHQGDDLSYILSETKVNGDNFSVLFAYQKDIVSEKTISNISCKPVAVKNSNSKFDLSLFITFDNEKPILTLEFNPEILSLSFIQSLASLYIKVLRELLVSSNTKSILDLSLAKEKYSLKSFKNISVLEGRTEKLDYNNIIEIFNEQVIKSPKAIAIKDIHTTYTYEELDTLTTQIALKINNFWRKDEIIGLYMTRSCETIIFIIAILKAGKAYIPLHEDLPLERIEYIVNQVSLNVVFSNISHLDFVDNCILSSDFLNDVNTYSKKMQIRVRGDSNAYILFTSGTTGNPKGVILGHNSLVNRIMWMKGRYKVSSDDTFMFKTPFNFDVSFGEIFLPLCSGASLFIAKADGHKDFNYLIDIIKNQQVSHIYFVPTMLKLFLEYLKYGDHSLSSLKIIFSSGEALMQNLVNECYRYLPNIKIINQYGPTEAGEVSDYETKPNDIHKVVPLGDVINNSKFLVLDKNKNIASIGKPGELYILGESLSKGYINNPILTKNSFVNIKNYGLAYKTADLVVLDSNFNMQYLSRLDNQVKVNGVRIELSEIEHNIQNIKNIEHAFVTTSENKIIAFFKTNGMTISDSEIYLHLEKKVPKYMLPSKLIQVDEFKVTINGKIDKKFLIDKYLDSKLSAKGDKPEKCTIEKPINNKSLMRKNSLDRYNKTQVKLINIWLEILNLNLEDFSFDDSFLHLGGSSILIAELILKIYKQIGLEIMVSDFVKNSTLNYLLSLIDNKDNLLQDSISNTMDKDLNEIISNLQNNTAKHEFKYLKIFVTGGTGFVGRNFIKEALRINQQITIICGTTSRSKFDDLLLRNYFTNEETQRIEVLEVDLSKEKLNLSDDKYTYITKNVDTIVHIGAYVNHLFDYKKHFKTNVFGTLELLKICGIGKSKKLTFISTTGCNNSFDNNGESKISFSTHSNYFDHLGGYIQSKLVAEQMLIRARNLSYKTQILRVGQVGPNSKTKDLVVKDNHVSSLVNMVMGKNIYPNWDNYFECLPADIVSNVIYKESKKVDHNKTILLANKKLVTWLDFFNLISPDAKAISHKDWYNNILTQADQKTEEYLYKLIPLYKEEYFQSEFDLSGDINSNVDYSEIANNYIYAIKKALSEGSIPGIVY
ncbi:non-ribosomal peptide synthetase [Francisella sp. SYW-9]|uniref:non-ribosomal peptide synthetase n=1 Tax=Francisella sp. SYW-9 TaxID=2610888 RepID=UPI00123D04AE|nr:non-ribosomal peptide synthetase [Francisella sp. SYW-9]